jgi:hypothetical protein
MLAPHIIEQQQILTAAEGVLGEAQRTIEDIHARIIVQLAVCDELMRRNHSEAQETYGLLLDEARAQVELAARLAQMVVDVREIRAAIEDRTETL